MGSLFEQAFLAPKLSFNSGLSLKEQLRLLTVATVIGFAIRSVKRSNMNSHVFVHDTVAIESESVAARIAADEESNKRKRQKRSE